MRDAQPVIRSLVKRVVEGPGRDGSGDKRGLRKSQSGLRRMETGPSVPLLPPLLYLSLSKGRRGDLLKLIVIPAEAGIPLSDLHFRQKRDPRLRGGDEFMVRTMSA